MGKLEDTFNKLHEALVDKLLKRIESGDATGPELSCARQLLKDNGIDSPRTSKGDGKLYKLADEMPFQDPETPVAANQ